MAKSSAAGDVIGSQCSESEIRSSGGGSVEISEGLGVALLA